MNHAHPPYHLIGIEPRDMIVYEALLGAHDGSIRSVARVTSMNRGSVYESIKKLLGLGLVTFRQQGERRRYEAADPALLLTLIDERRSELRQLAGEAAQHAAALETLRSQTGERFFAQSYEGDEGVAAILRDVLQTTAALPDKEYRSIASQRVSTFLYHNFPTFSRQRVQQGIFVQVISDGPPGDEVIMAERRQVQTDDKLLNGYTLIYGTKVALISLDQTNVLSGVVIDDEGISALQRLIFDQLWNKLEEKL